MCDNRQELPPPYSPPLPHSSEHGGYGSITPTVTTTSGTVQDNRRFYSFWCCQLTSRITAYDYPSPNPTAPSLPHPIASSPRKNGPLYLLILVSLVYTLGFGLLWFRQQQYPPIPYCPQPVILPQPTCPEPVKCPPPPPPPAPTSVTPWPGNTYIITSHGNSHHSLKAHIGHGFWSSDSLSIDDRNDSDEATHWILHETEAGWYAFRNQYTEKWLGNQGDKFTVVASEAKTQEGLQMRLYPEGGWILMSRMKNSELRAVSGDLVLVGTREEVSWRWDFWDVKMLQSEGVNVGEVVEVEPLIKSGDYDKSIDLELRKG